MVDKSYTVMLYCDLELSSLLWRRLLEESNFQVIMETNQIWDIVHQIHKKAPDCVLIEGRRSTKNGIEELCIIKAEHPSVKVTILSASAEEKDVVNALNHGADGYVLKNTYLDDFIKDLRVICEGNLCVSRELVNVIYKMKSSSRIHDESSLIDTLTPREREILMLVVKGESNRKIAELTSLSVNTVNNHISSIYKKLRVRNRVGATILFEKSNR